MTALLAILTTAGQALWPLVKPLLGPILAYWKGRREGSANERARAERKYVHDIEVADAARRRVDPDGVSDDEFNRDRKGGPVSRR